MKTLTIKTILFAFVAIVGFSTLTKADDLKDRNIQYSVNSFVNKIKTGKSADLASILSEDVKFNMSRNGKILTHGKNEELAFNKKNENVIQQCKVETATLVNTANYSLVKVSSIYEGFTREDFITLIKTKNDWKITDVTTNFK